MDLQDVQEIANFFERRVSAYQVAVAGEVSFFGSILTVDDRADGPDDSIGVKTCTRFVGVADSGDRAPTP